MTRAVIYCRFSPRPNAPECESIVTQLTRCRAFCQAKGWEIEAEFQDEAKSGGSTEGRGGLSEALSLACRRGRVLVVYSLSRLARNTRDALDIAERLDAAGADLAVLDMSIDTTSSMGRFVFTMMAALAQLEREQIGERTSDGMRRRQADGQRMSKQPPFGKQPGEGGVWIEHPEEQAAIRIVRDLKANGLSNNQIARSLDERGIPCRGQHWHGETVRRILLRS